MSVVNGQAANANNFNNAFVSKTTDSTVTSVVTLNHGPSAPSVANVQSAINSNADAIADHLSDTGDAHDASAISFVPVGSIVATDVQGAIAEVSSDVSGAANTALSNLGATDINVDLSFASQAVISAPDQLVLESTDTDPSALSLIAGAVEIRAGSNGDGEVRAFGSTLNISDDSGTVDPTIKLFQSAGVFSVAVKAPPSLAANYTLTLPVDDGASGQSLTTNGSGILSWASASGGGGGGSLIWIEDANAPLAAVENFMRVYQYQSGLGQDLYTVLKVPATYTPGAQIKMRTFWYSPDASGTALIQTVSTLIRAGVDLITSTANQRTSTNAAVTQSGATQNIPQGVLLDITSTIGEINAVAVSAGDIIVVSLTRGTDTGASDLSVLVNCAEVSFT